MQTRSGTDRLIDGAPCPITEKRGSGSAARWSFVKRAPRDGENVTAGGEKIGQQSRDAFIRRGFWDSCLGSRKIGEGIGYGESAAPPSQ
jgi:hypothetical protein